VIYSSDLTNLHNITGEQIGAYFGYSLCVLDMDGDGLDDIVVGSPMYTDFNDPAMKIETGRIYVIYQTKRVYIYVPINQETLYTCYMNLLFIYNFLQNFLFSIYCVVTRVIE
jgi:hypothetical protein